MSSRLRAYQILEAIDAGRKWVSPGSEDRDEAFTRTLVHGVMRWRLTLDHLIGRVSGRDISRIDQPVLRILRLGIYQLHWMRVPDHATVNESVELAKRAAPRGRSFVNAILRKATRENLDSLIPAGKDLHDVSIRTSHPEWLLERWMDTFGKDRMMRIAEANQRPSHPDMLIDTRYQSIESIQERLTLEGIESEVSPIVPDMLRVLGPTSSLSDLIEAGHVWPMDEGSAIVAMLAGKDRTVLDVAAAPGGKTLAMIRNGNRVISHDVSFDRLRPLARRRQHDRRLSLVVGDGAHLPFRSSFPVVVLDAPCSATGIIRKHPEIKWRLSEELIRRSAALQLRLLRNALDQTSEMLVYATCSLEREENDAIVKKVISERDNIELADARDYLSEHLHDRVSRRVLRLTPEAETDGFTAFVIVRRDPDHSKTPKPA